MLSFSFILVYLILNLENVLDKFRVWNILIKYFEVRRNYFSMEKIFFGFIFYLVRLNIIFVCIM